MEFIYRSTGKLDSETRKNIKEVLNECQVCKKTKRTEPTLVVAVPSAKDCNAGFTLDSNKIVKKYILWMLY